MLRIVLAHSAEYPVNYRKMTPDGRPIYGVVFRDSVLVQILVKAPGIELLTVVPKNDMEMTTNQPSPCKTTPYLCEAALTARDLKIQDLTKENEALRAKADSLQSFVNDSLQLEKEYSEGYNTLQADVRRLKTAICQLMAKGCDMIPHVSNNACTAFLQACKEATALLVDLDKEVIQKVVQDK